jgi:anti-sigma B factor antagonist
MGDGQLEVRKYGTGTADVVVVHGEVDSSTASLLDKAVADAAQRAAESGGDAVVVVDLTEVSFMDSAGLRVLVMAGRTTDVTVKVVVGSPELKRLLRISALDTVLDVHPSLDDALAA